MERAAKRIVEMLGLKKVKGFYLTTWGKKTEKGLEASIFNLIADAQSNGS